MFKRILIGILVNGVSLWVVTDFLDEVTGTGEIKLYIIGGLIIGLLNVSIKPIMKLLSLPFVILTAGLFLIAINAVILYFTQWIINVMEFRDVRLYFAGIGSYIIAALIFGIVNWAQNLLIKK